MNILPILLLVLLMSCSPTIVKTNINQYQFENIYFDVVQKNLIIDDKIPNIVSRFTEEWFNQNIKVNGFSGKLTLTIFDYSENISKIPNGKRIDTSIKFKALIENTSLSYKETIKGKVDTFGTIEGDFSLNEFDDVIKSTQKNLIVRLSKDFQSKI